MRYDRCPACKHPLYFHGVTLVKNIWRRWMECHHCDLLTNADQYGMMALSTKTPPTKNSLGRGE